MIEADQLVAGVIGGIGCALLGWGALSLRSARRRPQRLCPGPRRSWLRRAGRFIVPLWLVWSRNHCGYELRGLRPAADGSVTCPECGRWLRRRGEIRRSARRLRPERLGSAILVAAAIVPIASDLRWSSIVTALPAPPLLAVEARLGAHTPQVVRHELRARFEANALNEDEIDSLIALLIHDLRHDAVDDNAGEAFAMLERLGGWPEEALAKALHSDDLQQRQLAFQLLRKMNWRPPDEAMLRVAIESLCDRRGAGWHESWKSLEDATWHLAANAAAAEALLVQGLDSPDWQQRLHCAAALALGHRIGVMDLAAPILIEHLRDNDHWGDAKLAERALRSFGRPVLPWLEPYRNSDDWQQRQRVERIWQDIGAVRDDTYRRR